MAVGNTVTTNPIFCDTAGLLITGPGSIKSIQFSHTSGDNSLLLVDDIVTNTGRILIKLETTDENATIVVVFPHPLRFDKGLYCATIDAGAAIIQV